MAQARQELRWLTEQFGVKSAKLHRACALRSRHVPLQYILGSQPFGDLDIKCRKDVLIPRWETEEWAMRLTEAMKEVLGSEKKHTRPWKVTDLCTGTGCIPLTILNETRETLKHPGLDIGAIDISPNAIQLTQENYQHNFPRDVRNRGDLQTQDNTQPPSSINFNIQNLDILDSSQVTKYTDNHPGIINILTCNPPYIPIQEFIKDVRSSVRVYEPKLALIADLEFYENLVEVWISQRLIESFVYELGNIEQAEYVQKNVPPSWNVGVRYDSDQRPRCVYGYDSTAPHNYKHLFEIFAS